MRIRLSQLQKIIKEETTRLVREAAGASLTSQLRSDITRDRKFQRACVLNDVDTAIEVIADVLVKMGLEKAADWVEEELENNLEFTDSFEGAWANAEHTAYIAVEALEDSGLVGDEPTAAEYHVQIGHGKDDVSRSTINKIQQKHGVKVRLTGGTTANPNYKVIPSFPSEQEAQDFVDELTADGIDAGIVYPDDDL